MTLLHWKGATKKCWSLCWPLLTQSALLILKSSIAIPSVCVSLYLTSIPLVTSLTSQMQNVSLMKVGQAKTVVAAILWPSSVFLLNPSHNKPLLTLRNLGYKCAKLLPGFLRRLSGSWFMFRFSLRHGCQSWWSDAILVPSLHYWPAHAANYLQTVVLPDINHPKINGSIQACLLRISAEGLPC